MRRMHTPKHLLRGNKVSKFPRLFHNDKALGPVEYIRASKLINGIPLLVYNTVKVPEEDRADVELFLSGGLARSSWRKVHVPLGPDVYHHHVTEDGLEGMTIRRGNGSVGWSDFSIDTKFSVRTVTRDLGHAEVKTLDQIVGGLTQTLNTWNSPMYPTSDAYGSWEDLEKS